MTICLTGIKKGYITNSELHTKTLWNTDLLGVSVCAVLKSRLGHAIGLFFLIL